MNNANFDEDPAWEEEDLNRPFEEVFLLLYMKKIADIT